MYRGLFLSVMLVGVMSMLIPSQAAANDVFVLVDKDEKRLFLYQNGQLVADFPVAIGADAAFTPEGEYRVVHRIENPSWKHIPGGHPDNPLGRFWIGLNVVSESGERYGIHGTNDPESIGKMISEGCIRLSNEDIEFLVWRVPVGTPVKIQSSKSNGYNVIRKDRLVWVKVWGQVPDYLALQKLGTSLHNQVVNGY